MSDNIFTEGAMKIIALEGFSRIYVAEVFTEDFEKMFKKSKGQMGRYAMWLASALSILDSAGIMALKYNQFEYLQDTDNPNLYSIRHPKSEINDRYLYVYEGGDKIILLTVFKEKSTGDYKNAIKRANNIYKSLSAGGFENE
jgi:hypothetical protein